MLQDEIFILKRSLYESEFEFRRLKASYQMLSLECDELKAKNVSYNRRISTTEKVTSELEDCKCSKIELEEKNLRLQWNLTIKEASCHNNAQLKYEVAQIKDWHLRILEGVMLERSIPEKTKSTTCSLLASQETPFHEQMEAEKL
ncbi:hypothetical protein JHK85_040019 [Glycine max]|nr:hypothetical protein JHK85_040019 [Glycine max]